MREQHAATLADKMVKLAMLAADADAAHVDTTATRDNTRAVRAEADTVHTEACTMRDELTDASH